MSFDSEVKFRPAMVFYPSEKPQQINWCFLSFESGGRKQQVTKTEKHYLSKKAGMGEHLARGDDAIIECDSFMGALRALEDYFAPITNKRTFAQSIRHAHVEIVEYQGSWANGQVRTTLIPVASRFQSWIDEWEDQRYITMANGR